MAVKQGMFNRKGSQAQPKALVANPAALPGVTTNRFGQDEAAWEMLQRIKTIYERSIMHVTYVDWRDKCRLWWQFYDGIQWTQAEIDELLARGQAPVVINKIKVPIKNLSGTEIQSRVKIQFRPRNTRKQDETDLADALTELALQIQENCDATYKQSKKFKESLVCGIGWSAWRIRDGVWDYELVDSEEMVPDMNDRSDQFTNSSSLCREKWTALQDAVNRFPAHEATLKAFVAAQVTPGANDEYSQVRDGPAHDTDQKNLGVSYVTADGNRLRIIEVQYKQPATLYTVRTADNRFMETFSKADALTMAADKDKDGKAIKKADRIKKRKTTRIYKGFFCGWILLEHAPLEVQPYNNTDFEYIPTVYDRRRKDGMPVGMVYDAVDAQKECNKRRSKMLHLLNTNGVEADSATVAAMGGLEVIRKELARPDFVLVVAKDGVLKMHKNTDLAEGQREILMHGESEIQQVLGLYDEAQGKETNATSGVAIQGRQIANVRNHVDAFDNLRMMKKREGRMLLGLIQACEQENIAVEVIDDQGLASTVVMNQPVSKDGKKIYANDVRTLNLDIFVEETKDYEAPSEQQAESLMELLQNPMGPAIMQSEDLLRRLGYRDPKALAEIGKQIFSGGAPGQPPGVPPAPGQKPPVPGQPPQGAKAPVAA